MRSISETNSESDSEVLLDWQTQSKITEGKLQSQGSGDMKA